jgi:hypothetical protein
MLPSLGNQRRPGHTRPFMDREADADSLSRGQIENPGYPASHDLGARQRCFCRHNNYLARRQAAGKIGRAKLRP